MDQALCTKRPFDRCREGSASYFHSSDSPNGEAEHPSRRQQPRAEMDVSSPAEATAANHCQSQDKLSNFSETHLQVHTFSCVHAHTRWMAVSRRIIQLVNEDVMAACPYRNGFVPADVRSLSNPVWVFHFHLPLEKYMQRYLTAGGRIPGVIGRHLAPPHTHTPTLTMVGVESWAATTS